MHIFSYFWSIITGSHSTFFAQGWRCVCVRVYVLRVYGTVDNENQSIYQRPSTYGYRNVRSAHSLLGTIPAFEIKVRYQPPCQYASASDDATGRPRADVK